MKIKDRMLLGAVVGLGANLVKVGLGKLAMRLKVAEIDGPEIAAGIFIPPHKLTTATGKAVGYLADATIGGILGLAMVEALSVTGKNQAILKGALLGQIMWQGLYVLLGSFGGSRVRAYSPKTVLSELAGHTIFGMLAAAMAVRLGDEGIFSGKIPLSATPLAAARGEASTVQAAPQPVTGYEKPAYLN